MSCAVLWLLVAAEADERAACVAEDALLLSAVTLRPPMTPLGLALGAEVVLVKVVLLGTGAAYSVGGVKVDC